MKFSSAIFLFSMITIHTFSQSGEWVWEKGDTISGSVQPPPVWGTKGIGASGNTPACKYSFFHWQDTSGNFWIYGGVTKVAPYMGYNDVWKFDITSQNWIWIDGDSTFNSPAVYGVKGISSPNNTPGLRYFGGLSWTGKDGKFWLMGGFGEDNDAVMMYNPSINEWTWMSGSTSFGNPFYGIKGVASPYNTPGIVTESNASWVDNDGNFWFYGGGSALWKYDVSTLLWTWMSGDTIENAPPVYGAFGVPDANNKPGGRWCYASWKDDENNFWLFGGNQSGFTGNSSFNDVWKYSVATNEWAWVGGDSGFNHTGISGDACEFSTGFTPDDRWENRACLKDSCGNIWMYGGHNYLSTTFYDLWIYRPQLNDWSLLGSSSTHHYGTKGIADPLNWPDKLMGSISWFDHAGNMWLFGGLTGSLYQQVMWKYVPDKECLNNACGFTPTNDELTSSADFKAYPNPSSGIFTIEISSSENFSIEIQNVTGQIIFSSEEKNIHDNFKKQIDLREQPSGIYFLHVQKDALQWVQKIVIE